ncbi:hypothetical protein [Leptospira sp. GIMC2001]|uniref:hypothetical protein n=1 Tax=Leptospira sp. GIMC2001 TaxID=1513297 RepID=UPI00234A7D4C|nr:hypothetical protein [Leptospira sp. GIMC2001]WCL48405.1 hypothetical protein O4O04_13965 [Leptospira sp. GIMC2001]
MRKLFLIYILIFIIIYPSLIFTNEVNSTSSNKPEEIKLGSNSQKKPSKTFYKDLSDWDLVFYGGTFTNTDLLPIVFSRRVDYRDSRLLIFGISRPLNYKLRFLDFEVEANIGKHFGLMTHMEANALYIARINQPFDLPISFAIGEGLSLASENPKLENKDKGINLDDFSLQFNSIESRNLLNYLMVEFEVGRPSSNWPRAFIRIHHRSGIFGLYCKPDPACGSNFITYGFRLSSDSIFSN